jgi:hypothetical protein
MGELGRRIDSLSAEKRAMLEQRLLQRRRTGTEDMIPRRDPNDEIPLSFAQQRLWFLDQWSPGAPTYNAALPMRVRGELDVEALRSALEKVIERHEALRTVFRVERGRPVQVPLTEFVFELPVIDLRHLPDGEREQAARRLLRERARRPFDLGSDLMLRVTLIRLADEEHLLSFEEHHIAFDGWSDGIMFRELTELYVAIRAGREPDLPELSIQYADFALWQRARMTEELLDQHLTYWRQQLAGAPSLLKLPTDFPRPAVQVFDGVHYHFSLADSLAAGTREFSRRESATPFMTLLAAFAALLYRVTGEDDILVGSPIANRSRIEVENVIGFFSNTLVLRVKLGGNPTFRQLLGRVREVALGGYAHQDLPFEKVVEAVDPLRDASVNPLFQVNFRVQSGLPTCLELPGLEIHPVQLDIGFSRFDLALELQVRETALDGYFEYNTKLFRAETVLQLSDAFATVLGEALEHPDTPLLALDVPTSELGVGRSPAIRSFRSRTARSVASPTTNS